VCLRPATWLARRVGTGTADQSNACPLAGQTQGTLSVPSPTAASRRGRGGGRRTCRSFLALWICCTAPPPAMTTAAIPMPPNAWAAAARAWRPSTHIPGPPDPALREAAGALRQATHDMTPRDRANLRVYTTDLAGHLAARHDTQVRQQIRSELQVIAARQLAQTLRPLASFEGLPPQLASAALRGRWIPLPRMSSPAWTIGATTQAAAAHEFLVRTCSQRGADDGSGPRPSSRLRRRVETAMSVSRGPRAPRGNTLTPRPTTGELKLPHESAAGPAPRHGPGPAV